MTQPPPPETLADCPVCGTRLALAGDAVAGELLECTDCSTELEIISVSPLELKGTPEAEEEWDE